LDEKLLNERDSKVYRNKGRKQTCLRNIMGNVSINLVEIILTNVTEISFRKTSENIKTMCNQEICAQGVWNIVQILGEKIKELENRKIELNEKGL